MNKPSLFENFKNKQLRWFNRRIFYILWGYSETKIICKSNSNSKLDVKFCIRFFANTSAKAGFLSQLWKHSSDWLINRLQNNFISFIFIFYNGYFVPGMTFDPFNIHLVGWLIIRWVTLITKIYAINLYTKFICSNCRSSFFIFF